MAKIVEPSRETPVIADVDVCVIGGGPAGLPAAIAAARQGARTMLVEMQGFLGGMATAGLIGPILGHTASRSKIPAIGGLPQEICGRMADIGHAWEWERALNFWGVPFNAEGYKIVADRLVRESGVSTLLHTRFVDAVVSDGRVTHAIFESKSGRQAVAAGVFVDATGDADVADRAGARCTKGRPADGRMMAMGSMFRIGGVETLTEQVTAEVVSRMKQAVAAGELNLYGCGMGGKGSTIRDNEFTANITRFAGDCTNAADLTEGEFATRELTWKVLDLCRQVPGAEGVYLICTPPHVGIRESRQLVGRYRLTGADVVEARKHEDAVARCGYWIDIHCPLGLVGQGTVHLCWTSCPRKECHMFTDYADQLPEELYPPTDDWFDIPYRSLVPEAVDGLLVAGRCISADYQAMSALRVMGTCMAIGEAAGVAGGLAAAGGVAPREVAVDRLRSELSEAGALI